MRTLLGDQDCSYVALRGEWVSLTRLHAVCRQVGQTDSTHLLEACHVISPQYASPSLYVFQELAYMDFIITRTLGQFLGLALLMEWMVGWLDGWVYERLCCHFSLGVVP